MGALKNHHLELYHQGVWECPVSGILIPLGQKPFTQEQIDEMHRVFQMNEEEYLMYLEEDN